MVEFALCAIRRLFKGSTFKKVNASPALSSWLRAVALDLNKLGRGSWGHIRDDQVFRPFENPESDYYSRRTK